MIVSKFKYTIWVTITVIVLGIVFALASGGLNIGIDFTGGSITTIEMGQQFDVKDVSNVLSDLGIQNAPIVKSGDNWTQAEIRVQVNQAEAEAQADMSSGILAGIQKTYPNAAIISQDKVGGVASSELVLDAFLAVLIACALMMVYIWIRFELYPGVGAIIALLHDVIVMTAVMAIFRVQINSSYIAACLTIVGYSINDTIVLYDRIRDNYKVMGLKKFTRREIANTSFRQTLGRTINTSLTTIIMVTFLYIFGVQSIKEFAFPLIIGLLSGTYSSMFIAVPISVFLQEKNIDQKGQKKKIKQKAVKATK
jgi:preprotein translocase subunit SecF